MEHKEKGGQEKRRRRTDSAWNGTKRKELTNEWNQKKGGEVLDGGMRGKARPPLLLPLLLFPPVRMVCVCVFPSSSDLPSFHLHTETGRGRTWHR